MLDSWRVFVEINRWGSDNSDRIFLTVDWRAETDDRREERAESAALIEES